MRILRQKRILEELRREYEVVLGLEKLVCDSQFHVDLHRSFMNRLGAVRGSIAIVRNVVQAEQAVAHD